MRKYRFNNRARFAATYRDTFGELPSAAAAALGSQDCGNLKAWAVSSAIPLLA